ncbi:unnamed protein product [Ectocarpus sp. 12 AP-2014]
MAWSPRSPCSTPSAASAGSPLPLAPPPPESIATGRRGTAYSWKNAEKGSSASEITAISLAAESSATCCCCCCCVSSVAAPAPLAKVEPALLLLSIFFSTDSRYNARSHSAPQPSLLRPWQSASIVSTIALAPPPPLLVLLLLLLLPALKRAVHASFMFVSRNTVWVARAKFECTRNSIVIHGTTDPVPLPVVAPDRKPP